MIIKAPAFAQHLDKLWGAHLFVQPMLKVFIVDAVFTMAVNDSDFRLLVNGKNPTITNINPGFFARLQ